MTWCVVSSSLHLSSFCVFEECSIGWHHPHIGSKNRNRIQMKKSRNQISRFETFDWMQLEFKIRAALKTAVFRIISESFFQKFWTSEDGSRTKSGTLILLVSICLPQYGHLQILPTGPLQVWRPMSLWTCGSKQRPTAVSSQSESKPKSLSRYAFVFNRKCFDLINFNHYHSGNYSQQYGNYRQPREQYRDPGNRGQSDRGGFSFKQTYNTMATGQQQFQSTNSGPSSGFSFKKAFQQTTGQTEPVVRQSLFSQSSSNVPVSPPFSWPSSAQPQFQHTQGGFINQPSSSPFQSGFSSNVSGFPYAQHAPTTFQNRVDIDMDSQRTQQSPFHSAAAMQQQPFGAQPTMTTTNAFQTQAPLSTNQLQSTVIKNVIYSQLADLKEQDLVQFKSDSFQFGMIPTVPPPIELCFG